MRLSDWFKRPEAGDEMVRMLDESGSLVRVAARELGPHMVEVELPGYKGLVWIDARELRRGDRDHPPLPPAVRDVLRRIKGELDEFYSLSIEEWEEGFLRAADPRAEIARWLHLATTYRDLTATSTWNAAARRDLFCVLLACLTGPRESALERAQPATIATAQAKIAIERFFAGWHHAEGPHAQNNG